MGRKVYLYTNYVVSDNGEFRFCCKLDKSFCVLRRESAMACGGRRGLAWITLPWPGDGGQDTDNTTPNDNEHMLLSHHTCNTTNTLFFSSTAVAFRMTYGRLLDLAILEYQMHKFIGYFTQHLTLSAQ